MTKYLIIAAVALSGSLASAGKLDAEQYNYEDGVGLKMTHPYCQDGDQKIFYEARQDGFDGMVYVTRTCKDGRWYPKTTTTGKGCVEGRRAIFTEVDQWDRAISKSYVCKNGKYVPAGN